MPVVKVKINGVWQNVADLSTDNGNADTLDGKHADEFALAADVEQKTQVQIITWEADD